MVLCECGRAQQHSHILIAENIEQLLHQAVGGQRLVVHNVGEVTPALLQFPPRSVQQGVTQAIDSCWVGVTWRRTKKNKTTTTFYDLMPQYCDKQTVWESHQNRNVR